MSHRDRSIANTRCEAKRIYHQRKHINRIEKDKKELQQRIDKAMEFIEGEVGIMPMLYGGYMACDELTKVGIGELYEILEGGNNE